MADSVIQPATNDTGESAKPALELEEREADNTDLPATAATVSTTPSTIIWTTRFIVIFTLTLVISLSVESLVTMGWVNHYYRGAWPLLAHVVLVFGCMIAILRHTRSGWIRMGSIFGCTWAIFLSIYFVTTLYKFDPTSPIPAYLGAAYSLSLLGAYVCLSIEHTPLTKWDIYFFRLILVAGICIVALAYLIIPAELRSSRAIESIIAEIGLVFSILVWWFRPSCWKAQPGPTFLLGLSPALIFLLSITGLGHGPTNFFLTQIALFCLLLGAMRILQGELCNVQIKGGA